MPAVLRSVAPVPRTTSRDTHTHLDSLEALAAPVPLAKLRRLLLRWYKKSARDLPWRRTRDPYAIWVSETMLQQTTVEAVLPYYGRFLARYPGVIALSQSREDDLLALWSGLGYYRRARNMRAAASLIVERYSGRFPASLEELRALPGIGRYTAGAIGSIVFGLRAAVVDGNVARVLTRLYALPAGDGGAGNGPKDADLWRIAEEIVPSNSPGDWNQALMELGARICRPSAPACPACPVATICRALAAGDPVRFSPMKKRPPSVEIRAHLVAIERRGRILLVRRPASELLGGLWELPGTLASALRDTVAREPRRWEVREGERRVRVTGPREASSFQLGAELGFEPVRLERIGTVSHSVTHRRLTLDLWRAGAPARIPSSLRRSRSERHLWIVPEDLGSVPMGAASRKALDRLLRRE